SILNESTGTPVCLNSLLTMMQLQTAEILRLLAGPRTPRGNRSNSRRENLKLFEQAGGFRPARIAAAASGDAPFGWTPVELVDEGMRRPGHDRGADDVPRTLSLGAEDDWPNGKGQFDFG